ncbi:hypothetical protein BH24BAC1_BH24BAC1_18830 [soil metagenome]
MENLTVGFNHLTEENRYLLDLSIERDRLFQIDPDRFLPILFKPCRVKVLLVADGSLDFSLGDFGLRTFVQTLLGMPYYYVRFQVTLAHINNVSDDAVMVGHTGISRSIKRFRFDDPSHFTSDMYDQIWLFGISTFYFNRGTSPNGQAYPTDRLSDAELRALSEFMNNGGGLFATGDHGELGKCLSGSVPRARSMRLWDDTSSNDDINEVSMGGPRRNDTNRRGNDATSEFNDQSDDVPQTIQPKLYQGGGIVWRYSYPHPLLCGPKGIIRVLPDHPHEGECVQPTNTSRTDTFGGYSIVEYPAGIGGSTRPLPEVIATSSVLAGTTSGGKTPTRAHSFGAICAYDGHRAGVGRVVTDATWHHFVNVNLVGDSTVPPGDPKRRGYLQTTAGQAHLENIKAYYRNIAVWISRPSLINCMNRRLSWGLVWHHRVIEAVTSRLEVPLEKVNLKYIYELGKHSRDVLGNYASQCQSRQLVLELIRPFIFNELLIKLDPWYPVPEKEPTPEPDSLPWFDPEIVLDVALGGALLALREKFPEPIPELREEAEKALDEVLAHGVRFAVSSATQSVLSSNKKFILLFSNGNRPNKKNQ